MLDIGIGHYLTLGAVIFTIGVVGIFSLLFSWSLSESPVPSRHRTRSPIIQLVR